MFLAAHFNLMLEDSFNRFPNRQQRMRNIRLLQIAYCIFILLVVALADLGLMSWFREYAGQYPGIDKAIHFFLVGGLSWVLIFVFNAKRMNFFGSSLFFGTIVAFALVTLEESSQLLIDARRFELLDLLADYLGILVAEIVTRRACLGARRSNA